MATPEQTSREYMTGLRILHAAFLIGQVLFAGIAYYLHAIKHMSPQLELDPVFRWLVPGLVGGAWVASGMLYRARLMPLKQKPQLEDKLGGYYPVFILRLAVLEAPALLALVAYLITAQWAYLGLAVFVMILFVIYRPTRPALARDLDLSPEEAAQLNDPDAIVAHIRLNRGF